VPGSIPANPADYPNPLVVSGSYIDNFTVTFLIRAVEANQNTTSLTAPRLTLFSGQRAVLIVQTQQAYVSGLTPVVAPGAALFDPQVQTTTATGVVLSVQATVSPDRKYVFLDLRPQLARLRALVPFSISAVVQPVNNVVGGTTTPEIVTGTLQLPTIDITEVETSCSVPDGATLLLGGQTLAAETTREQGVPVLSKIPFIKRLFTNRATAQDEQILLILVKPTILIQREQELKQFPQLSAKVGT
jgi:type II secretory pathway component GspD/PulD (secretin)